MRFPFLALALLVAPAPAFAHKMLIDARVAGEVLRVEVFYADDTPAEQARIVVLSGDQVTAEGKADDTGVWTCPRPGPGTYTIRAEALGHASRRTLVIPGPEPGGQQSPPAPEPASRAEQTQFPARRVVLGLGIIAAVTLLGYVLRRSTRRVNPPAVDVNNV